MSSTPAPGWFPDPLHRHERRYWNGARWTEHVADGQATALDPLATGWAPPTVNPTTPPPTTPPPTTPPPTTPPPTAPPPAPPPGGGAVPGPGRRGLLGAAVVVALVLGAGIFVGVRWGKGDEPRPPTSAVDVLGAGTPGTGVNGYLSLGESDPPVTASIGSAGGTLAAAGGVSLSVPAGAFAADTTVSVVTTQIIDDSFGDLVTSGSTLITVDDGGTFALQPVLVSVPVDVPDGTFALAVFYDDTSGTLEPLPIVALGDGRLVASTRHFSSIFVTIIDVALLDTGMIDSGFRPGVDSWQFVNYGSYVAPGGHCSGQSLSALWYYETQKLGSGAADLFGRFDDRIDGLALDLTTGFQWDDSDGYRFASTIQADQYAAGVSTYEQTMRDLSYARVDRLQYYAFAYAILLTGMPQYVAIWSSAGGGHAMIVYAVTADALLISDPNFPSEYREIPWNATTGVLGPYEGQANGATEKHPYETVGYYAKSALVDWTTLGARWQEFLAGSIGDDRFPGSSLEVREVDADGNESWVPLTNGYQVAKDVATITVRRPATTWNDRTVVYKGTDVLVSGAWDRAVDVPLAEGVNPLGFAWWYFYWKAMPDGRRGYESWVDFNRINVVRGDLEQAALDLVFVIDLTSSMEDDIDGVKAAATDIVQTIDATSKDWRVAIVGYRDVGDEPMFEDYPFATDAASVIGNIDALSVQGGGDDPEAVYEALMRAIDSSTIGGWRPGQNKQIILMGDAPPHVPGSNGETAASVARAAELADPVVVQSVVVGNAGSVSTQAQTTFEEMSSLTKGRTFTAANAEAVPAALQQSIAATVTGPSLTSGGGGTDWGRLAILLGSLALVLLGAGVVLRRVWRGRAAGGRAGIVAAGAMALAIGLAGVGWWGLTQGGGTVRAPLPAADAPIDAPATQPTDTAPPGT